MKLQTVTRGVCALCCVTLVGTPRVLGSQEIDCKQLKAFALVRGVDSAYAPAQALADELRRRGFTVDCILRSHSESMFDGQAGAALYRTNEGTFDVLFMPAPETFDRLVIVERREGTGYVYSFEGEPKPWPANRIESVRRMYVVKDAHRLLIIWGDDMLAERLRHALMTRQQR